MKNWYPLIDYEKCVDHCHGCGNRCPEGAITYLGEDTDWIPPKGEKLELEPCLCSSVESKKLVIDFLYLDLNTCERCMATDSTLDEAVNEMKPILNTLGYNVEVNKINVNSVELANEHGFLSSPTIRVNGNDICLEVKENNCKSCGDICGSDVDCRVFVYEDDEYEQPPKAMIVDGILKEMYSKEKATKTRKYILPENLKKFFKDNESPCCVSSCDCEGGC